MQHIRNPLKRLSQRMIQILVPADDQVFSLLHTEMEHKMEVGVDQILDIEGFALLL